MWVNLDNAPCARTSRSNRRGVSIVYVGLAMFCLIGLVSLAVDLGRVRSTHEQLQNAADAGALAGVAMLPDHNDPFTEQTVVDVAAKNIADNKSVDVVPGSDIEYGLWSPTPIYNARGAEILAAKTWAGLPGTIGGVNVTRQSANALRVTTKLLTARGNQVNLVFARVLGVNTSELVTPATAYCSGGFQGAGFVGLDFVRFVGTTATDSWNGASGPYNPLQAHNFGSVSSNGSIDLNGTVAIHGDARPGIGELVYQNQNSTITGWTAPLDEVLAYPADPFSAPGTNNNAAIVPATAVDKKGAFSPSGVVTVPAGSYVFDSAKIVGANTVVNVTAPAKIYVRKDFSMSGGQINILGGTSTRRVEIYVNGDFSQTGGAISNPSPAPPSSLYFSMTGNNTSMKVSSNLNAHIYAPLTAITFQGNANNPPADFYGWAIGKSLTINGNANLHYDETSLMTPTPRRAVLVK
jgi:hypothetical protein